MKKNFNYRLEIDILRNSLELFFFGGGGVLRGAF